MSGKQHGYIPTRPLDWNNLPSTTLHGTEEREVFLPAIGDPGDETTEKPFVGVNRCWNCGQMYVADHDHLCRFADTRQGKSFAVAMAPTAEEMASAIRLLALEHEKRECLLANEHIPHQRLVWANQRVEAAYNGLLDLAARLPRGRE